MRNEGRGETLHVSFKFKQYPFANIWIVQIFGSLLLKNTSSRIEISRATYAKKLTRRVMFLNYTDIKDDFITFGIIRK